MTRLTKETRERMATVLLRHRFDAEGKALAKRSAELFELVYEDQYDQPAQQLMAKLLRRYKYAFTHSNKLYVNCAGRWFNIGGISIGGDGCWWKEEVEPRPVFKMGDCIIAYLDCPIAQKLTEFSEGTKGLGDRIRTARAEVMGLLASFSTAKQLAASWPEAMPLVADLIPDPTSRENLPAVQISRMNEAFGLPPVAQEGGAA